VLVTLTVLSVVMLRRPALKKRYETMDDKRLVEIQGQGQTWRRNLRIGAYLAPVPVLVLSVISQERGNMNIILCVSFFASFSLLFAARIFGEIERLATTELEFRKYKKEL